jgi:GDP-L-fucose synthase
VGSEITIKDLLTLIADLCGYKGQFKWNHTKPDGQPRRSLEISKAQSAFGFKAQTDLRQGLAKTIQWFESHRDSQ